MRISSLTTLSTTSDIDVRSAFIYVGGAKAKTTDLANYIGLLDPAGKIEGAMYTLSTSIQGTLAAFTVVSLDTVQYDNTSWTNANSVGLFQVPTDEFRFVEVEYTAEHHSTSNVDYSIGIIDPSVNAQPSLNTRFCPGQSSTFNINHANNITTVVAQYVANSGDLYQPTVYYNVSNQGHMHPSSFTCFTIRGIR